MEPHRLASLQAHFADQAEDERHRSITAADVINEQLKADRAALPAHAGAETAVADLRDTAVEDVSERVDPTSATE